MKPVSISQAKIAEAIWSSTKVNANTTTILADLIDNPYGKMTKKQRKVSAYQIANVLDFLNECHAWIWWTNNYRQELACFLLHKKMKKSDIEWWYRVLRSPENKPLSQEIEWRSERENSYTNAWERQELTKLIKKGRL